MIKMKFNRKIIQLTLVFIIIGCSSSMELPDYNYALDAYHEGKYQTALTYINRAIEMINDEPEFYVLRAKANYKMDNKKSAMKDLNKSLKLGNNFNARYLRGKLFLESNKLVKAKKDFREAYNINPDSPDLLFDLGYLEFAEGENQLAIEYYTKAAKLNSRNPATYVNLGNLYAMMGDSKTAIDNYSKALVLDTTDGIAYYNRANEKMLLGDFTGAIEDYENSILIDSINVSTLFILAEARLKINDITGALENYNQILNLDSTLAKAFYLRGSVEALLDKSDQACNDFKKAGELGYFDAYEMIKKWCDPKKKTQTKKTNKK